MAGELARLGGDVPTPDQVSSEVSHQFLVNEIPFNPIALERQAEVDGILERYKDPVHDQARVDELHKAFAKWEDEFGLSYLYMSGHTLPGLTWHGPAQFLAFCANVAPDADFSGADLQASLWTATQAPRLHWNRAILNHAIAPLAVIPGVDMQRAEAHDLVLNLADITNAKTRGAVLPGSYLIGTNGLTPELLSGAATIRGSRVLSDPTKDLEFTPGLGIASRFETGVNDPMLGEISAAKIYAGQDIPGRLMSGGNMPGSVFLDLIMTEARMTGNEYEGSIWSDVVARRLGLRAARMGGVVIDSTDFSESDLGVLHAPGMAGFGLKMRGLTELSGNIPGLVLVNSDLQDTEITPKSNMDGAIILGGTPPEVPESVNARVVQPEELPAPVAQSLLRYANRREAIVAADQAKLRELEAGQEPES